MAIILIADDDANIRKLMSLYLRKEGFEIKEASDGVKALSIVENSRVDLVILDIMILRIGRLGSVQRNQALGCQPRPSDGNSQSRVGTQGERIPTGNG